MGEITDALRRARTERGRDDVLPRAPLAPAAPGITTGGSAPAAARDDTRPDVAAGRLPQRADDEPVAPIPRVKVGDWVGRAILVEAQQAVAECFRQFAIRVRGAIEARGVRSVLVTSALRREGKTTVACNLALALASVAAERRAALVDLDLHRPGVARSLGVHPRVGLERVLDGDASLESARICTEIPALHVYAVANSRPHAHEVFSSRHFPEVMQSLTAGYDVVIVDTPPVLLLPDVALIAPHVGAYVAVVRAGSTPRSAFRELLVELPQDRLIGCFLNDARMPRHARQGYPYRDDDEADAVAVSTAAG